MITNDLEKYTKDELAIMFVNLINDMQRKGDYYLKYYNESTDKYFDIDKYTYACGLLTFVNRINNMIKK